VKRWQNSLLATLLTTSAVAFFGGCGSESSSDVSTAYLVDSGVKGVSYHCGTQSGITGTDGVFNYQNGQMCTFSIGETSFSVPADKLSAGKKVTPYDIFTGDDEKAINLAILLQTLDTDNNATNGIDINATAREQIQHQIEFGSNFEGNLTSAVTGSAYKNQIRTRAQALAHLATNVPAPTTYTAFERIAEIDASAIQAASGLTNPTDQARYVARKIAKHFYMTNDTNVFSNADWVLGGAPYESNGSTKTSINPDSNVSVLDPYILEIPSPDNNKTMIVEVCNKKHAGLAMSMGAGNSPALPCEISIYMDTATNKIYVDILDPVGSFAIFFNKVTENQAMLTAMALQVKTEIKLISYNALQAAAIAHVKKATPMGPKFTTDEIKGLKDQYLTYTYDINTSSSAWANETNVTKQYQLAAQAASALITKMTVNNVNSGTFGINGTDLNTTLVGNADYNLSADGYWRSARSAALKVPRSSNAADDFIYTVEACSPTYAKIALSLGANGDSRNHTAALPCQMSFYIDNSDIAHPKLKIVFLNPTFMFQTLFKDMMSGTQAKGYTEQTLNAMLTTVTNDLVNMTRYVMDHNTLGWVLPNPTITAH